MSYYLGGLMLEIIFNMIQFCLIKHGLIMEGSDTGRSYTGGSTVIINPVGLYNCSA